MSLVRRRSAACSSTSTAEPPIPADPWCMRMRACGSANRLPRVPADSRNWPALHAMPNASVATSHGMSRMTSRIASMDGTEPPGELIHSATSASGSSSASVSNCVASRVPLSSSSRPSRTSTRRCEQGEPELFGEYRSLCFLRHGSSVRMIGRIRGGAAAVGGSAHGSAPALTRVTARSSAATGLYQDSSAVAAGTTRPGPRNRAAYGHQRADFAQDRVDDPPGRVDRVLLGEQPALAAQGCADQPVVGRMSAPGCWLNARSCTSGAQLPPGFLPTSVSAAWLSGHTRNRSALDGQHVAEARTRRAAAA